MQKKYLKTKNGFTLVETMISISLFLIIIISGIGALVNTNLIGSKAQNMHSIMDNLSFIMEDMSRNLKTGYNFHCDIGIGDLTTPRTCAEGGYSMAFEASGNTENPDDQWVYKIELGAKAGEYNIFKSTEGGSTSPVDTFVQLNPDEVVLGVDSKFLVLGDETGDVIQDQQPMVIIRLVGEIYYKDTKTPFSIQTSASQRFIES